MTIAALDFNRPETADGVGAELATTTASLAQRVEATTVTDLATLEQAVLDRQAIGDAIKRVQEFFKPLKQMADRLHGALCDREKTILVPLQRIDLLKREAIRVYHDEDTRRRQERERELSEARRRDEQTHATNEAAYLEAAGETAMAEATIAEALAAPPPVVTLPDVTKTVDGLKFTRYWRWRYVGGPKDVKQTPPAIVARARQIMPRDFLIVDEKKIGAYARTMQASGAIPGVEIYYVDEPVR